MQATATTASAKGSIGRILLLAAGALLSMALGAAIALAATGSSAQVGSSPVPSFDSTGALRAHVLRENGVVVMPASAVEDALHEHVLRENGAR